MKLTKNEVDKLRLPDGRADHIFWDDGLPGFGVRCRGPNKTFRHDLPSCRRNQLPARRAP